MNWSRLTLLSLAVVALAVASCTPEDSGRADAGTEPDAGIEADAGSEADAGLEWDGGAEPDAGRDGGSALDAGIEPDAGSGPDAGTTADAGTKPDAGQGADGGTPPVLIFVPSPVANLPGVRFARAVPYGPEPEQVMDVFLPPSTAPTGAIFYFHGGGFVNGSRTQAYAGTGGGVRAVTAAGVAWIGVDYRLLEEAGVEKVGLIKSLRDIQRSVQFVRAWAQVFNVRPDRIGLYGTSAGAGASLWLAFHPEMADASSPDRVARQSTRVTAASAVSTQATYDLLRWSPDVFADTYPYMTNTVLFGTASAREMTVRFYGLPGALVNSSSALQAELKTPALVSYRKEVDMLALFTADDPPVYVQNTDPNVGPLGADFDVLHHPLHARALQRRATAVGATFEADIPAFNVSSPATALSFLLDRVDP